MSRNLKQKDNLFWFLLFFTIDKLKVSIQIEIYGNVYTFNIRGKSSIQSVVALQSFLYVQILCLQ